ncbi:MAG: thioredoxin family protein [Mastigocoleus sp. MO_167.B18]|nr:thioredoxin family protein [Mastigocoleus sp. MO_167.B18]
MTKLEKMNTPVGNYAPDFELPGIDERVHHLHRYLNQFQVICVISMCNQCPYVNLYLERLKNIQAEFSQRGFTSIGMNGADAHNKPQENFKHMKAFAEEHELNFPYLWDSTQDVTRSFGATKTPMAFLIDKDGVVRYKGQIDSYPQNQTVARVNYLKEAITSLLNNQVIITTETEPFGTPLVWRN